MEDIAPIVGIATVVLFSAWYLSRRSRRGELANPKQRLLRMCLGDKKMVRRLVALEMDRIPGVYGRKAILRAIDSLRRDNTTSRLKGLEEMPAPRRTPRQYYFRLRTNLRHWTVWVYVRHSLEIAVVVLVLYGICRLLGIEFPTRGRV
jgi:hypothetical protein